METNTDTAELLQEDIRLESIYGDTSPNLKITVECITPDIARELLTHNLSNRPISANHVQFLANQMSSGKWLLSGEPIQLSVNSRLLNGQHRLSAIVLSGTTQQQVVIWDLPEETFHVMDTGRIRVAADVLDIAQVPNARCAASLVRMIINYERGSISRTMKNQGRSVGQGITNGEILAFVQEHDVQPFILRAKSWYKEWRVFSASEYGFIYYVLSKIDADAADAFISSMALGANLPETSPVFVLRKKLETYKINRVTCSPTERLALTFKAWNLYRKEATVKFIGYNPEREDFPVLL